MFRLAPIVKVIEATAGMSANADIADESILKTWWQFMYKFVLKSILDIAEQVTGIIEKKLFNLSWRQIWQEGGAKAEQASCLSERPNAGGKQLLWSFQLCN